MLSVTERFVASGVCLVVGVVLVTKGVKIGSLSILPPGLVVVGVVGLVANWWEVRR